MNSKRWLASSMTVAMAMVVAACAKKEEDTQANIEVQTEAPPPPPPVTIDLVPATGSAVMGTVTATHAPDKVTVQVSLSGLDEKKDYDAKMRYGDCTVAPKYLTDTTPDTATPQAGVKPEHKTGDDFMTIRLDKEGATATGEASVDLDELGATEPAYLVVTADDALVACADLKGHDTGAMTGSMPGGASMGSSTTPMPSDTMNK
jgi:hypothetical protein